MKFDIILIGVEYLTFTWSWIAVSFGSNCLLVSTEIEYSKDIKV